MAVDTESDVELIEHLDFEGELPCVEGDAPAVWSVRCECGSHALWCEGHRVRVSRRVIASGLWCKCQLCGRSAPTIEELWSFVPIKSARDVRR